MKESQEKISPLEQMNQILSDKEAVIDSKLEQLKTYRKELTDFENQLKEKVSEVQKAQFEIASEKEAIQKAWDEIHVYEKNLETTMEQVLAEKVLMEQRSMSDLKKMLEEDDVLCIDPKSELQEFTKASHHSEEFDLNLLRRSVGIDVPDFGTNEQAVTEEPDISDTVETTKEEIFIPEVFIRMEKEITKSYPKWTKLEMVPERYCVQFGEKEIRFFDASEETKVPRVEIIVFRKNARTDRRLQGNIAGIERVATDWSISTEENQIVCTMHFTADTKASVVLKKCNEFIKKHLN